MGSQSRRIIVALVFLLAGCVTVGSKPNIVTYSASGGAGITVRASSQFAGAIDSVTWNGKEFIDRADHGRELQSASSFDNHGECYNPTEAGSSFDWNKVTSSSVLLGVSAEGNTLKTNTQMAYWLRPGESASCGGAKNAEILSEHILSKEVRIEAESIRYLVTFTVPKDYTIGVFEVLTGYMPVEFSTFWSYDPVKKDLVHLSDEPGEQFFPVIFSSGSSHAMGIFSKWLDHYGRFRFHDTVKWNVVYRPIEVPAGRYSFECHVVVGTLQGVIDTITRLGGQ